MDTDTYTTSSLFPELTSIYAETSIEILRNRVVDLRINLDAQSHVVSDLICENSQLKGQADRLLEMKSPGLILKVENDKLKETNTKLQQSLTFWKGKCGQLEVKLSMEQQKALDREREQQQLQQQQQQQKQKALQEADGAVDQKEEGMKQNGGTEEAEKGHEEEKAEAKGRTNQASTPGLQNQSLPATRDRPSNAATRVNGQQQQQPYGTNVRPNLNNMSNVVSSYPPQGAVYQPYYAHPVQVPVSAISNVPMMPNQVTFYGSVKTAHHSMIPAPAAYAPSNQVRVHSQPVYGGAYGMHNGYSSTKMVPRITSFQR